MRRRFILWFILASIPISLFAADPVDPRKAIEIKLRITAVDTPTRKSDTNFQLAATLGFSVVQALGNYYLYTYSQIRKAWMSNGTDFFDLVYPRAGDPNLCNLHTDPRTFDPRCGDNSWVVWKQPSSTTSGWNYFNRDTGLTARVAAVPAIGAWPYVWNADYPKTGVPGQQTTLDARKVNTAIPTPPVPSSLPTVKCNRNTWNPNYYATGTANTKAVTVNGKWYMAFNIDIDSPDDAGGWTSEDMFRIGWATSDDGKNWTVRHVLFRTSLEQVNCGGGLVLTQLFTDNNYFYLLADEQWSDKGLILLRAPINTSTTDGYTNWQVATGAAGAAHYLWVNVPADGLLDTHALNTFRLMCTNTVTQQAQIGRVFSSSAPNSPSRLIAVTVRGSQPELWSAPDLDTPFIKESSIDLANVKPIGIGGGREFSYTYDPNNTPATPALIGNEFDFWLTGNFYPDGHANSTGISFTGYRTTATLSGGDIYAPHGALRSAANFYLSAAADHSINATPASIGLDERWVLVNAHGGTPQSGDVVYLQARNGLYVTNNGGSTLAASQAYPSTNETFIIEKKNAGGAAIGDGDLIALRSQSTGKYIIASAGGGSTVFGNGLDTNPNTRFTFVLN